MVQFLHMVKLHRVRHTLCLENKFKIWNRKVLKKIKGIIPRAIDRVF